MSSIDRDALGRLIFEDYPHFNPNLTPQDIFAQGAFGGTYWRPIYSSVTKRKYEGQYKKYPFLEDIDRELLCCPIENIAKNKFRVHSGTTLEYWESKKWITSFDPYGWVQWYCEFYSGRRCADDERQIKRWRSLAGPNGRFYVRLINMIKKKKTRLDDPTVSPIIRQCLHHWAVSIQ